MLQEWYNPQNERRYLAELFEDLFGDWILIRRWWGVKRRGNKKMALVASYADGLKHLANIDSKRQARGYQRVR
jgi:hypothetical protein